MQKPASQQTFGRSYFVRALASLANIHLFQGSLSVKTHPMRFSQCSIRWCVVVVLVVMRSGSTLGIIQCLSSQTSTREL